MAEPIKREAVMVVDDLEVFRLLSDPFRMSLLGLLSKRALTIKEMAKELDTTPHRLYYHINKLEAAQAIRVVETHLVNGIVEKVYATTAVEYVVKRGLLNFETDEGVAGFDVLLRQTLDSTREDIIRSGREGTIDADAQSPDPTSLFLRRAFVYMTEEQAREVHTMLQDLITRTSAQEHTPDDGTTPYVIQFAVYPTLSERPDETDNNGG